MSEHTPRPWVVDEDPTQSGDHLTMVTTPGRNGFMGTWIAGCIHNWNDADKSERRISWDEAEANARLITTAPDGLELAQMVAENCTIETPVEWVNVANAILNKAKGVTQ